jgi:hypothetical protein
VEWNNDQERLNALNAERDRLLEELDRTAEEAAADVLMSRIDAIVDDIARTMGFSEAEIAETNRQAEEEIAEQIRRDRCLH